MSYGRYKQTGRKRKGYISRKDREQDTKIRRLEQNVILKQHTTPGNSNLTAAAMVTFSLNLVPQGESDLHREGATIRLVSIAIRWKASGSEVATTQAGAFRILLFIDSDPRGALPASTEFLTSQDLLSAYNSGRVVGQERNRGRFKFLYDQNFSMITRPIASADSLGQTLTGKIFAKLGNTRVMYTTDTGVIENVEENNLVLGIISIDNTQAIAYAFNAVLRFTAPD